MSNNDELRTETVGFRVNAKESKCIAKLTKILSDCGTITNNNSSDALRYSAFFLYSLLILVIDGRCRGLCNDKIEVDMSWFKLKKELNLEENEDEGEINV